MRINKKHISNGLFIALLAVILFVPSAKAFLIQGLMKVGLFSTEAPFEKPTNIALNDVKFKNEQGEIVSLNSLKGKIVFINFWATWCPPCIAEMPSINKLYEKYKNDKEVVFILIDVDENFEKSTSFIKKKNYNFPLYHIASNVNDQIFSGVLPTTVVLDKMGRLAFKGEGAANYSSKKFINFMEKLKTVNH